MPTQRNRYFSSIANTDKNHSAFGYAWSDNAVITGTANPITGAWVPIEVDASGRLVVSIDSLSLSGAELNVVDSGVYTPNFTSITGSQFQIPAGVRAYSIIIESGYGFVDGTLFNSMTYIAGGALGGGYLSTRTINVGTTGNVTDPSRILIAYET